MRASECDGFRASASVGVRCDSVCRMLNGFCYGTNRPGSGVASDERNSDPEEEDRR
jgi:hypothetical protein